MIVTDVPPVMGPVVVPMLVTVGRVGDQVQLFTVIPVPQYTTHCAEVGELTMPAG